MSRTHYSLPGLVDIAACSGIQTALAALLGTGEDIIIDGKNVERISTSGIQLLLAAGRTLQSMHSKLSLTTPSAALTQAIQDIGVAAILLPEEKSA